MLILPPGHAESVTGMRRLTVRERRLVRGVLGAVAVLAVGVVVALATASRTSAHGCLHLTIPGPVGAEEIDQCGTTARETCASVAQAGGFSAEARSEVAAACRRARLAVG